MRTTSLYDRDVLNFKFFGWEEFYDLAKRIWKRRPKPRKQDRDREIYRVWEGFPFEDVTNF